MLKPVPDTAGLLGEVAHPGRPKDEEPHIKRSVKKKQEVIDYLVRVDLEELGIDESNFEELQALFRMFDNDKDGVLSIKEFEKVLAVLGRSGSSEVAERVARSISADPTELSVSFNEYLSMLGEQRLTPTTEHLLEAFEVLDREGTGKILEEQFRRIMRAKLKGEEHEVDEMVAEYRSQHQASEPPTPEEESYIDYKKFVTMLHS